VFREYADDYRPIGGMRAILGLAGFLQLARSALEDG
jgi:hypothetical protein